MRFFALSFLLFCALLSPSSAYASKLEEWNFKNLPTESGEDLRKKITASEIAQVETELQRCYLDQKVTDEWGKKILLRDRMLKSFLQQRPVIGLKRDEVYKLLADCAPPPAGTLRAARTRIFQIYDGTKVPNGSKAKQSITLEVSFINDVANGFRINLTTFEKPIQADFSTEQKEPTLATIGTILERPNNMGSEPWLWRIVLEHFIPPLVSEAAEKAGITEDSVTHKCYISFNLSKQGITKIAVKPSSRNPKFDNLVIDTLKRLSTKPGLRLPEGAHVTSLEFEIGIGLLVKESDHGPYDAF